jgi:hypothetical protein
MNAEKFRAAAEEIKTDIFVAIARAAAARSSQDIFNLRAVLDSLDDVASKVSDLSKLVKSLNAQEQTSGTP